MLKNPSSSIICKWGLLQVKVMSKEFRVVGCVDWSVIGFHGFPHLIYFSPGITLSLCLGSLLLGVKRSSCFQTNRSSATHLGTVSQSCYLQSRKTDQSILSLKGHILSLCHAIYCLKPVSQESLQAPGHGCTLY